MKQKDEDPVQMALPRILSTYQMLNPDADTREAEVRAFLDTRLTVGVDDPERLIVEGLTFLLARGPIKRNARDAG